MVCKVCGKKAESEYCFRHKPRKSIKASPKVGKKEGMHRMHSFFLKIWSKRAHYSEVSHTFLGHEPLSVFFHHILPKGKYPEVAYNEENIVLLTLNEHETVERDPQAFEVINQKRELLKTKLL